ncbi:MAG: hypothetical protein ACFFB3_05385 [Candidatus Hodarchaeota archaeon]
MIENSKNTETLEILRRQLYLLDLAQLYYHSEKSLDELAPDVSASEMQAYLNEHDYPPRPKSLIILKQIEKKIESERQEALAQLARLRESYVQPLNDLVIIPSWTKALDVSILGTYLGQEVTCLEMDTIVILVSRKMERTVRDEPVMFLTGPGVYFTKFKTGPYLIVDYKEITGVVLPKHAYERIQNSAPMVESDLLREYLREDFIRVPFSLLGNASDSSIAFQRGVVARNVFHPYKDPLDTLISLCWRDEAFHPQSGFKLLSGHAAHFSEVLVHEKFAQEDTDYMKAAVGIIRVIPHLKEFLAELLVDQDLEQEILWEAIRSKRLFVEKTLPIIEEFTL